MNYFYFSDQVETTVVEAGKVSRQIKAYSPELMMVEVFFEAGAIGYEHTHPHVQTTYCLEGSFEFQVGGVTHPITVGDTLVMPADIRHGCKLLSEKGRLLDVFTPCREDFLTS